MVRASPSDFVAVTQSLYPEQFQDAVLAWFQRYGRKNLPWQTPRDPYRVWISEIMLQQTQVATVIPYFERFIQLFPDVTGLADAPLDDVLAAWAGLGYYARCRNLHRSAQAIVARHGGQLPDTIEALTALPGIGRSTAGAILSLGMEMRAPILDGNVKRVLARYHGLEGWPGTPSVARELWRLSEAYTPLTSAAAYNQAMMDLGATVCSSRRPACAICPIQAGCSAKALERTDAIPSPKPKLRLASRCCWLLVLRDVSEGKYYFEKRPPAGIWGGLWSFPEFREDTEIPVWCADKGMELSRLERWPERRHTFSHFHLDYRLVLARASLPKARVADDGLSGWFRPSQTKGLPAPIRRIVRELETLESGVDARAGEQR
jgi:A/G-specific adenine glycosylase